MAQSKIIKRARNLVKDAKEAIETTQERIEEAKDKTGEAIKENPFTSVAIAAAVGALVALGVNALISHHQRPVSWKDRIREYF